MSTLQHNPEYLRDVYPADVEVLFRTGRRKQRKTVYLPTLEEALVVYYALRKTNYYALTPEQRVEAEDYYMAMHIDRMAPVFRNHRHLAEWLATAGPDEYERIRSALGWAKEST